MTELKRYHSLLSKQIWMVNLMYILIDILNLCSKAYYTATPLMSDLEFDANFNLLEKFENDAAVNWEKIKKIKANLERI